MKKIAYVIIVLMLVILASCRAPIPETDIKTIYSFTNADSLPGSIQITPDGHFVYLITDYPGNYYKLSVGNNYNDINVVYDAGNSIIKNYSSNSQIIAWFEYSDSNYSFKYYNITSKEITEIRTGVSSDELWQLGQISVYNQYIYYVLFDYDNNIAAIYKYDTTQKNEETVITQDNFINSEYSNGLQYSALNLHQGVLSISRFNNDNPMSLLVYSIDDNTQNEYAMPDQVALIYASAFDRKTYTISVYYYDKNKEKDCIGVYSLKDNSFKIIAAFNENNYAYNDCLLTSNGNLLYVLQNNVSGTIADHYNGVKINIEDGTIEEANYCFSLGVSQDSIHTLSFDKIAGVFDKINYGIWE